MNTTREEIAQLARVCYDPETGASDYESFFLSAYRMGQEEMRERVSTLLENQYVEYEENYLLNHLVECVNTLPLEGGG